MSNSPAGAQAPKRQRGHVRVAAIMDAGVEVFMEKGFDAATMTEIAARSGTAIGSLYRFFPSKESLADALLLQYAEHATNELAELEKKAEDMRLDEVSDALVDFILSLQTQRSFAISLVEERGGRDAKRLQFRETMRAGISRILRQAIPNLTLLQSQSMAVVVLHILKGVASIPQEKPSIRQRLLEEIQGLLRVYFASRAV